MKARALRLTAIAHGLRSLWNAALYPRVSLDFLSGALDPRVTFSRGSNATLIGSDGKLQYAPHNLLTHSEQFDNAVWAVTAATISANAVSAPNGTQTADQLVETVGTGTLPRLPIPITLSVGQTYSASVYAKEVPGSSKRYLQVYFNAGFASVPCGANFNLATGTVTYSSGLASTSVENVGDGWWRCTINTTAVLVAATGFRIALVDNPTQVMSLAWNPDGTGSLYVWGAQLNVEALQPYYSTTVKNLLGYTQEFDNAAWSKTNAAIATNLLTYSEQFDNAVWAKSNSFVQTNRIRNNTMQGAVVGTPGTNPTSWTIVSGGGLSREITSIGTENGVSYVDVRFFGTGSSVAAQRVYPELTTSVAAANGQVWSLSAYVKLVAGTAPSGLFIGFDETGPGTTYIKTDSESLPLTATLTRSTYSATLTGGVDVAFILPQIGFNSAIGIAVDFTLRIGLPQLVQGAVAGDPVPTYGTARAVMYPAPDGSLTADKLAENTATDFHVAASFAGSFTPGTVGTISCYLKAAERSVVRLQTDTAAGFGNATFDLSTGTVTNTSGICSSATATPVGNGWYRCAIVCTATGTGALGLKVIIGTTSYTGDGTSGIYIWGAQIVQSGAAETYQRTEATIQRIVYTAPDGSVTADKFVENAGAGVKQIFQFASWQSGTRCAWSVYAKAAGRSLLYFSGSSVVFPAGGVEGYVNLNTGATSGVGPNCALTVVDVGNGWWRCCIFATAGATATNPGIDIRISSSGSDAGSYTGDGTSGIFIWGAQLSDSASLDPYVYNPAAAPSNTAYYGLRRDYDPVTLAPKGLLIEEQRTNLAINSGDVLSGGTGGVVVANQITAPDGSLADFFQEDTGSAEHYAGDRAPSVTAGTTYTWSFYAKLGLTGEARRVCVRTGAQGPGSVVFDLETGSSTVVSPVVSSGISSAGNGWFRCWIAYTATGTGVAVFRQQLAKDANTVYTGNGTSGLFFWGAQLEVGAFPTSYIPTTTAAATRAADIASVTGANFSNWYNQAEGTTLVEAATLPNVTATVITYAISDGTFNQSIYGNFSSGNSYRGANVLDGGVGQASAIAAFTGLTTTNNTKDALAYKANDFAESCNGVATRTDTAGTVPAVNRLYIGSSWAGSGNFLNGHIRSFKYYPTRLSNAELQAITS